jgi:hypothetical protein
MQRFSDLGDWEISLVSGSKNRTRTFVFESITDDPINVRDCTQNQDDLSSCQRYAGDPGEITGSFIRRKYEGE